MKIEVLCHSSIRIETQGKIIYSDPFKINQSNNDADLIIITHSHYDHFSEEDILKVKNDKTKILVSSDVFERTLELGFKETDIILVMPNNIYKVLDLEISTIPAYNTNKKFHPKENNWVGYILDIENKKVYIAGDTDVNEDNLNIECDIALVPVGGTYTMDYKEAAELINNIKPELVIPMHYGDIVGDIKDGEKFSKLVDNSIQVEVQIL